MGAHDFATKATGDSPEKAYRSAVQKAQRREGRNPYNGTISTTKGFVVMDLEDVSDDGKPSVREVIDYALEHDKVRKRGNCACFPMPNEDNAYLFAGWAAS